MRGSRPLQERYDPPDLLVGVDDLALLPGATASTRAALADSRSAWRLPLKKESRVRLTIAMTAGEAASKRRPRRTRGLADGSSRGASRLRISAVSGAGSEPECLVTLSYLTSIHKGQRVARAWLRNCYDCGADIAHGPATLPAGSRVVCRS